MAIEMLSYRQLGERLGCSRDAARMLVKQLRLPRHKANDGKALVSVDTGGIRRLGGMLTLTCPDSSGHG